jgi:hypothetical protein
LTRVGHRIDTRRYAGRPQLNRDPLDGVKTVPRDIDSIIDLFRKIHPQVSIEQLRVSHPGDDAGIWFFKAAGRPREVQLESSTGMCPFLIESDSTAGCSKAMSVEEAISTVGRLLGL